VSGLTNCGTREDSIVEYTAVWDKTVSLDIFKKSRLCCRLLPLKEPGRCPLGEAYILFLIRSGANLAHTFTRIPLRQNNEKNMNFMTGYLFL